MLVLGTWTQSAFYIKLTCNLTANMRRIQYNNGYFEYWSRNNGRASEKKYYECRKTPFLSSIICTNFKGHNNYKEPASETQNNKKIKKQFNLMQLVFFALIYECTHIAALFGLPIEPFVLPTLKARSCLNIKPINRFDNTQAVFFRKGSHNTNKMNPTVSCQNSVCFNLCESWAET